MSKNVFGKLAVILVLALLTLFTATGAFAFDARSGDTVIVPSGEVVDDDLYIAAGTIIIDGTINGDVWAAARSITVNGTVSGSVHAAGETVNVNGDVGQSVRAGGNNLRISGNVNRDIIVGANEVEIDGPIGVGGDLIFGANNVSVNTLIQGDIKGGGAGVTIRNGVEGNVELWIDSLTILPSANIQGDLTYNSENAADIQSGAQILGSITHNLVTKEERFSMSDRFFTPGFGIVGYVVGFLMAFVAGVVLIFLAPSRLTSVVESIRTKPGASVGWGAIALIATPIAAVIVLITVVGIPVSLITLALLGIAIYLSQIPVGLLIGKWIIGYFSKVEGEAIMVGALALGLVILRLLGIIPFAGFFISLATILFGLGAIVVSVWRGRAGAQPEPAVTTSAVE